MPATPVKSAQSHSSPMIAATISPRLCLGVNECARRDGRPPSLSRLSKGVDILSIMLSMHMWQPDASAVQGRASTPGRHQRRGQGFAHYKKQQRVRVARDAPQLQVRGLSRVLQHAQRAHRALGPLQGTCHPREINPVEALYDRLAVDSLQDVAQLQPVSSGRRADERLRAARCVNSSSGASCRCTPGARTGPGRG